METDKSFLKRALHQGLDMKDDNNKRLLMVFPMELASHYLRCLELCRRLRQEFKVMIAYSPRFKNFIERTSLETFNVHNFDPEEVTSAAAEFDFSWLNRKSIECVLNSQIDVVEEYRPEAVLGDTSLPLKMAAEKTGIRFISLLNGYMTKYYLFTRKVSRTHPGYQYSRKMPSGVFDLLTRSIEHAMFRKIHEPFRAIRRELGLSSQSYLLDELEGDLNLICDLPQLFPQKRLPPNYRFISPLFYRGDEDEREITDFIGDHHPNMLVSMGSTGNWDKIALLNDPIFERFKIIASGNESSTLRGPNVISRPFLNNVAVMDKIDILICHGGNGTIYQALSQGVPALCIPSNFEQEWNVQRIEELELGTSINDISDAKEIYKLIDLWITKRNVPPLSEFKKTMSIFSNEPTELPSLLAAR